MKIEFEIETNHVEVEQVEMEFKFSHTGRGFALIEFQDGNGKWCSFQKSSVADKDMAWLGHNDERMHLTRHQAMVLGVLLLQFGSEGELPTEEKATELTATLLKTEPEWETPTTTVPAPTETDG